MLYVWYKSTVLEKWWHLVIYLMSHLMFIIKILWLNCYLSPQYVFIYPTQDEVVFLVAPPISLLQPPPLSQIMTCPWSDLMWWCTEPVFVELVTSVVLQLLSSLTDHTEFELIWRWRSCVTWYKSFLCRLLDWVKHW